MCRRRLRDARLMSTLTERNAGTCHSVSTDGPGSVPSCWYACRSPAKTGRLCQHAFLTIGYPTSRGGLIVGDRRDQVDRPPLIRRSAHVARPARRPGELQDTLSLWKVELSFPYWKCDPRSPMLDTISRACSWFSSRFNFVALNETRLK
jgi:hypothetical protein